MTTAKAQVSSVHSPTSVSRKKLAANRRNARLSTGPRTDEGKRIASRNAVTHAIFCRDLLVGDEREGELVALRESVRSALAPTDAVEHGFVDAVVIARWQLRRLRAAGRHVHEQSVASTRQWGREKLARWQQRIDLACSYARPDEREVIRLRRAPRRARYEAAATGPLPVELTIARDLTRPDSAWERLGRYEQRLEQSIARSMRELRLYRKDIREFGRPEVDRVEDDVENHEAQNEPTDEESLASDGAAGGCDEAPSSMGVPPMHSDEKKDMGETPMLRKAEQPEPGGGG